MHDNIREALDPALSYRRAEAIAGEAAAMRSVVSNCLTESQERVRAVQVRGETKLNALHLSCKHAVWADADQALQMRW